MKKLTPTVQDSIDRGREAIRRAAEADGHELVPRPKPAPLVSDGEGSSETSPIFSGLHPFFRGLLETLPDPGEVWPIPRREQWLETARNIFALIYADASSQKYRGTEADMLNQNSTPLEFDASDQTNTPAQSDSPIEHKLRVIEAEQTRREPSLPSSETPSGEDSSDPIQSQLRQRSA